MFSRRRPVACDPPPTTNTLEPSPPHPISTSATAALSVYFPVPPACRLFLLGQAEARLLSPQRMILKTHHLFICTDFNWSGGDVKDHLLSDVRQGVWNLFCAEQPVFVCPAPPPPFPPSGSNPIAAATRATRSPCGPIQQGLRCSVWSTLSLSKLSFLGLHDTTLCE